MNSDTERGGTHRGVGIGVNQVEGETKTRGGGIESIFIVFYKGALNYVLYKISGLGFHRFEGYEKV